jgi:hypothetical protein
MMDEATAEYQETIRNIPSVNIQAQATTKNNKTHYPPQKLSTSTSMYSSDIPHSFSPPSGYEDETFRPYLHLNPLPLTTQAISPAISRDKAKGLREFSYRVSMKVEEKGCTSYNEVADELVHDMAREHPTYDQKNIRRRVYDALNVLMAIGVIAKEKKLIRWIGLPSSGVRQEINELENEKRALLEAISAKRKIISERLRNEVAIRRLILRNKKLDILGQLTNRATVRLPFLLLHVPKSAIINGYVTQDG